MKTLTFKIKDKEAANAKQFRINHHETCVSQYNLTSGEYFSYIFTPSGIGTNISIKCNICGKEENITDYDNW